MRFRLWQYYLLWCEDNFNRNRSPVFVRVKAETLAEMITNASKFILCHTMTWIGFFGSRLAARKLGALLNKEAKIIFDPDSLTIN